MTEQNSTPPNELAKNPRNIWITTILVVTATLIAGTIVYFWQNTKLKATRENLQRQITALEEQINLLKQSEEEKNKSREITQETVSSIDQTWDLYTNNKYGFSIKVPKETYHSFGSMCSWKGDSYRPAGGTVPVEIFEDGDTYISTEYFYELTGATTTEGGTHNFSGCNKVINSIIILNDEKYFQQQGWKIINKTIKSDTELESFIQERYGSGCKLGSKNPSTQEGVFDITVQGDGKDIAETACPLNYVTVLKYYPAKNKAVSWDLGQAATFYESAHFTNVYDQEMVASFRFE